MNLLDTLIIIVLGYLIGSIPFALIIGKVFYKTDVRKVGSGNLGGTNIGRSLGKKAGIMVILLDASKAAIAMFIAYLLIDIFNLDTNAYYAGIAVVIGHCYPIFAGFKGGKGVASAAGFILVINPLLILIALAIFLVNLKVHKMVSLGVLVTVASITIIAFIFPMFDNAKYLLTFLTLFLAYQHRSNIKRIIDHNENKITWL